MYYLGLGDRLVSDFDHSGYSLKHMLKAWDVPFDTQYNTSTVVRGGDLECSRWGGTLIVLGGNYDRLWGKSERSVNIEK